MIRRIKHIHDLKLQQQLLLQKQELLEKQIKEDWTELKECLKPGTILSSFFSRQNGSSKNGKEQHDWLSSGIAFVAKKIISKMEGLFS